MRSVRLLQLAKDSPHSLTMLFFLLHERILASLFLKLGRVIRIYTDNCRLPTELFPFRPNAMEG